MFEMFMHKHQQKLATVSP